MIRSLRPTEIVAILASGSSLFNHARSRDGLGWEEASGSLLRSLVGQIAYLGKLRHSWVWIEKNRIQGVISIRRRRSGAVWEISSLRLGPDAEKVCFNLLDALGMVSAGQGAARFFLRLSADSTLMEAAKKSGFTTYARQRLYAGTAMPSLCRETPTAGIEIHLKRPHEEYTLFQIYNRIVPEEVRRAEGLTFEEWQESREVAPSEKTYVCENEGKPAGWMNIRKKGGRGRLEMFTQGDAGPVLKEAFCGGMERLTGYTELYCLAFTYQTGFCRFLEDAGFRVFGEHCLLAREQLVRLKQPYLVPAGL